MTLAVLSMSHDDAYRPVSRPATGTLEEIVVDLQKGEEGALEALIQRTERACYRMALSILKDPDLSKDALQDTYLIVYQRIGQLREPAAVKSWLFKVLTRCCHDISRKRSREFQADVQEREEADSGLVGVVAEPDPASQVSRQEKIKATFDKLPEIDRTALGLREIAHMSYEEMAATLRVPIGTVRSRLAKARKRFIATYRGERA